MAENKKSFKLYTDQKIFVDQLPDELAGRMFKHLFQYVTDENPIEDDLLLKLAFAPIKRQLKHDLKKYSKIVERNRINGKKGGRNPNNPMGSFGLKKNPNKADKDKDKDKEDKKGFLGPNIPFKNFWEMYGKKEGFNYTEGYWNNLDPETQKEIMNFLPKYIASKPNPRYRKKPENFLIDEAWKDELPEMDLSEIKDKTDPRFKLLTRDEKIKWIKLNIKF